MPKLKTNKAAAKRFKRTKNGKFKRNMAFGRHLKTSKSSKRRRKLRTATTVGAQDEARLRSLLPYG